MTPSGLRRRWFIPLQASIRRVLLLAPAHFERRIIQARWPGSWEEEVRHVRVR
jgi:hypothetical protein